MDKITNEQLAIRIKAGIDPGENLLILYQQNKGLIFKIANKYRAYAEMDDLMQEGYIGLCYAVDGYNPKDGSFSNYAWIWIRQTLDRYTRNNGTIRIPVLLSNKIDEYKKIQNMFILQYGRDPTDYEMRRLLDLTVSQFENLKQGMLCGKLASLEAPIKNAAEDDMILADVIPGGTDPGESVPDQLRREQIKSFLWDQVGELPEDQKKVIELHYKEDLTYKRIAENLGMSYSDVSVNMAKGIKELRSPKRRKMFRKNIPEWVEAAAYHGSGKGRFFTTRTSSTERVAIRILGE